MTSISELIVDDEWNGDNIFVQVETCLLNVPRRAFAGSPVFEDMFAIPQPTNTIVDGSDRDHPLKLEQIEVGDFKNFMRISIPRIFHLEDRPAEKVMTLASALKLAKMWQMDSLRDDILEVLDTLFDASNAAEQVYIAKTHGIDKWLLPGIMKLAERPKPLSASDMKLLGLETSAAIAGIREEHRNELRPLVEALEEDRSRIHRAIYDSWVTKCECRACEWGKSIAPNPASVPKPVIISTHLSSFLHEAAIPLLQALAKQ